ncbi:site-specific integrase [Aestuariibaculum lutulentum]|uniref:Site-specific integrase n=1 Tax=Aestuariibaculum lutulentum TaxID=2920935 RepID=A0ABS9RGC9_9FLAO|nr:site-specific integrase [Aestuariibaculum lutulentum]MCH4552000.1 site-specific integrase [Aestuariibaculum lutulentum]
MANVKTILDTRRAKSDGNYNIIYRITHFKKVYTINSGYSIPKLFWDAIKNEVSSDHPNAKLINIKLFEEHYKIQHALLMLDDQFTIEKLKMMLDGKSSDKAVDTFEVFANKLIKQMLDAKRTGNAIAYQAAVNRLIKYCGKEVSFEELNYELLDGFIHHLKASGLKQNSIASYLRSIRAIYNKAIKHKLVGRAYYPFSDITVKVEKTPSRAISKEAIIKLNRMDLEVNSAEWQALQYFMLSFYLRGISFTDMAYLKHGNICGNRIEYQRRKTHKHYSVKLFSPAKEILNNFRSNGDYLLPILSNSITEDSVEAKKILLQWIKTTNKYLKRLSKQANLPISITTYTARYTFAQVAKQLRYSNEMIAEALGHEYGNKTTNIYLDSFDVSKLDEMHKNVIF